MKRNWQPEELIEHWTLIPIDGGELLIVITPDSSPTAISDYAKRWFHDVAFFDD